MSARKAAQPKIPPAAIGSMSHEKQRRASVELLRQLLVRQLDTYRKLLDCARAKREAIRTARIDCVTEQCQREQKLLSALHELELKREPIVRHLAGLIGMAVNPNETITSTAIADRLDEPDRSTLQALTAQLRETIDDVKRVHSIVRQATDALSRHMNGVMQSVQAALNQSGVYERRGRLAHASQVARSVDLRS